MLFSIYNKKKFHLQKENNKISRQYSLLLKEKNPQTFHLHFFFFFRLFPSIKHGITRTKLFEHRKSREEIKVTRNPCCTSWRKMHPIEIL